MLATQPTVAFSGVQQIIRARFTTSPGLEPGRGVIDFAPQPGTVFQSGTLEFTDGYTRLAFPDCRVERVSFHFDSHQAIWRLHICDRRWRWRYGAISGAYNLRRDNGNLIRSTERTPTQLAELCLAALGEESAEIAGLSGDSRPMVEWDYDKPALALAGLAQASNCQIALGHDNIARIRPIDTGVSVEANERLMQIGEVLTAPVAPEQLVLVTSPVRAQCDFKLEPVGVDVDQEVRPIDELTFRPYDGWSLVDPEHFQAIADPRARELAKESVFRWYRIATPVTVPEWGEIEDLSLIAPIEDEQATLTTAPSPARNRAGIVYGVWCDYPQQATNRTASLVPWNGDPRWLVTTPFTLDRNRGLLKFARPVVRYAQGRPAAAQLALRGCVRIRHPQTLAWRRLERTRIVDPNSFGAEYLRADDLLPTIIAEYDPNTFALAGATTNFDAIRSAADSRLALEAERWNRSRSQRAVFAGLRSIEPATPNELVTWSVGPTGATTEVARELEAPGQRASQARLDTLSARRQTSRQRIV